MSDRRRPRRARRPATGPAGRGPRVRGDAAVVCLAGPAIVAAARARGTETYGRWPWGAALAAPVATAGLYARRARLEPGTVAIRAAFPLLLWHQTEEWVLPSGFLPWFNRTLWHSDDDRFPLTPQTAFAVNVLAGWGVSAVAALSAERAPAVASAVFASHVANGALHVGAAIEQRRYNPGLATALVMGPLGALGVAQVVADRRARARGSLAGVVAGLATSAALALSLRRRVRSRRCGT